jgi:hypothetical protein
MSVSLAIGSACAGAASAAEAVDPSGTWKWDVTIRDQNVPNVLKLKLKDKKLTGAYKGFGMELTVEKGKIEGKKLSFEVVFERDGETRPAKFEGELSNDDFINGTVTLASGESRSYEWEAKRAVDPDDVVGDWKVNIKTNDGEVLESTLKVSQEKDQLKATYTSRFGKADAQKIQIKDNALTFEVNYENEGRTLVAKFKGKPRGDVFDGTVDYDLGGDAGSLEFKAKRQIEEKPAKKNA